MPDSIIKATKEKVKFFNLNIKLIESEEILESKIENKAQIE